MKDYLPNLCTVNKAMMISESLKINNNTNQRTKQMTIDKILDLLDLIKTKNMGRNELSSGQKKKQSIALELLIRPYDRLGFIFFSSMYGKDNVW